MKLRDNARLGSQVFVYRNLHQDCWSIRSKTTGRVVAHADHVELSGARFKVSQAGRRRVLEEQRKNVHAGVEGTLVGYHPAGMGGFPSQRYAVGERSEGPGQSLKAVTYNPYKYETFVTRGDEAPIEGAEEVVLRADKQVWAINPDYL